MKKSMAQETTNRNLAGSRWRSIVPHTELGLERIVFFSDAVFAIAMTLLAIEIRLPEENIPPSDLANALLGLMPRYVSFAISFFVIGLFWLSHHRMFEYIHVYDRGLLWYNLIFLFLIAFMPFPTAVLGRFPAELTSVVFYAAVVILLALMRVLLWWHVYYRAHLVRPETDPRVGRVEFYRAVGTAIIFGISILIAFWDPVWAMYFWIAIIPISIFAGSREIEKSD